MSGNIPVSVTAFRFTSQFETIPRRIELDGVSYELDEHYRRVRLTSEDEVTSLYDVHDSTHRFRLRYNLFGWRLVSISSINA